MSPEEKRNLEKSKQFAREIAPALKELRNHIEQEQISMRLTEQDRKRTYTYGLRCGF